jgi:eukaryotic-like serine/threonine-protein kinase
MIAPISTFLSLNRSNRVWDMDSVVAKRIEKELVGHEVGGWTIITQLNAGKSAVVFKAVRENETAAVKIFDPELVERYGKAAQLSRIGRELSLRGKYHPNLIKILDGGECPQSGYLFVAMEFVEGPNLGSLLSSIPRDRIWPLVSQIASAARFLEGLGLAHRDIKPDNVVISADFQRAVLLDLGVLRPFGVTGLTDEEQRAFVGTLQYSPPEFLVRDEEDSSDGWRGITFYQLGCVLHDVIMRKRIFAEYSAPYARLAQAVERVNPRIEASDIPADLVVLAASCLLKDPKLRLSLVKWEDFDPPELRSESSADEPENRIRRRRAMAEHSGEVTIEVSAEQRARSARRILNKLQAALQSAIHQECIGTELFPPLEIHDSPPANVVTGRFRIHFPASTDHALSEVLTIFVTLELLEDASEAVKISYAAGASQIALDWKAVEVSRFCPLFKGVYNQVSVTEKVKAMLYRLLDAAQQVQRSTGQPADAVWLTSGDASEAKG